MAKSLWVRDRGIVACNRGLVYGESAPPCACESGICCLPNGTCEPNFGQVKCEAEGGTFVVGANCVDFPCGGACCLPNGLCQFASVDGCAGVGGTFQGLGTTCEQVQCQPPLACCSSGQCQSCQYRDIGFGFVINRSFFMRLELWTDAGGGNYVFRGHYSNTTSVQDTVIGSTCGIGPTVGFAQLFEEGGPSSLTYSGAVAFSSCDPGGPPTPYFRATSRCAYNSVVPALCNGGNFNFNPPTCQFQSGSQARNIVMSGSITIPVGAPCPSAFRPVRRVLVPGVDFNGGAGISGAIASAGCSNCGGGAGGLLI